MPEVNSPDVRLAATALKNAIDRHVEACEERVGEGDPAVQEAYDAVRAAAEALDNALFDTYEEVTPFLFASAPVVAGVEDAPVRRFGVFLRRDYAVSDPDALVAAAAKAAREAWPEGAGEMPDRTALTTGRAVYELLNAAGVDALDATAEDAGLEPLGGTIWVLNEAESDESLFEEPFGDVDEEAVLYRLDEVFEG